jgi:hypothetical protein
MQGKRFFFAKKNQKTPLTSGRGLWPISVMAGLDRVGPPAAIHA